jgi:uncharacterized protein (TIGR03437 family)
MQIRVLLLMTMAAIPSAAQPVVQSVYNAASYSEVLAPGCWIAIFGTQLAPTAQSASSVPLPTGMAGVSVSVDGQAAPGAVNSPVRIPVRGFVAHPQFVSTNAQLSFTQASGGAAPAAQSFLVQEVLGLPLLVTAIADSSWISVSPYTGVTPQTFKASVNAGSLAPGNYRGKITLSAPEATVDVPVFLTVTAANSLSARHVAYILPMY